MNIPVPVAKTTAQDLKVLTGRYGLTLEEFLRASLHFSELLMPTLPVAEAPKVLLVPASEEAPVLALGEPAPAREPVVPPPPPPSPDFLVDFFRAVQPIYELQPEFGRVSAMVDDAILNLRAQHVAVASMRSGQPIGFDDERKVGTLADPTVVLSEKAQYATNDTLDFLASVPRLRSYLTCYPVIFATLDLNSETSSQEEQRGLSINRNDMARWLPVLQYYGWVRTGVIIGNRLAADDAMLIAKGFSRLMAAIVEGVCFLFQINLRLPQVDMREDLLIIRHRGQSIAKAMGMSLLQVEASVHQLNGHVSLMTEKLLILSSEAKPLQPIYGSADAVPGMAEARIARGRARATLSKEDIEVYQYEPEVTG